MTYGVSQEADTPARVTLEKIFLDKQPQPRHNYPMLVPQPEWLEVANTYLQTGSIADTAYQLAMPPHTITEILAKRDVRSYIDSVYLDLGYRNKAKLAAVLDRIIDSKLEEAQETGMYSSKDLADLLMMVHKIRMDELKAQNPQQTNIQVNNYGTLMEKLLGNKPS